MKYLAAYALASLGEEKPTKDTVTDILRAAGVEPDSDRIEHLFNEVGSKDIAQLIEEGSAKLQTLGTGAAAPSSAPAASGTSAPAEAKKEEVVEEEDEDMGLGLFD